MTRPPIPLSAIRAYLANRDRPDTAAERAKARAELVRLERQREAHVAQLPIRTDRTSRR
jgi:hypothetical protein